ncbi:HPr family phosphocarrier protein [Herbiconiux sp. CPCC 203407]|uniref:Phosphocarrier protein HPr n=1 Tax=Herbiconiux oxytropis TaxID=2970915 RepID=A0AA41XJ13_9MICO|nr:HPr family phosphocarrier protein [Herbiconiux oxytropis]MCS5723558.1 HPr family phosphocarrier protein [Herbiconiux oxytropis]MCS5727484.1 HPr family phosphocarrier protein [Herbiconiux oxytropis]
MTTRTVTIGSRTGLHARPAALFVKAAAGSGHAVQLTAKEKAINAASLLSVMSLGIAQGEEVTIEVTGDEEARVADELAALLASDLDAE